MDPNPSNSTAFIFVTLLIKLGVVALLAGFVARFGRFRRLLFIEQRSPRQKLQFAAFLGVPFMLAMLARLLARLVTRPPMQYNMPFEAGYPGTDLSLEVTVLGGLLGGTIVGLVVGMIVSLPAVLIGHELLSAPMAVLYAVVAGTARWVCPDKEEVWKFSPFVDLSLYRSIRQRFKHPALDWQLLFSLVCVMLEISRMTVGHMAPRRLFFLDSTHPWAKLLIVLAAVIGVGLPVRIWNNTRIERKLQEQERALMQARVDALISQINPHFLFNTLNTATSLIRFDPDTARAMLHKLSNILRRRLRSQVHFVPLKQELDFVDDYLDIEVVRFGRDKLQIRKQIDAEALDMAVPSMILQPLVENAIRHGIGPKIEGGVVTLRVWRQNGRLSLEVSDNGVGIPDAKRHEIVDSGIGITNVRERLKVLYGEESSLRIESQPGEGTVMRVEIPEVITSESDLSVHLSQ